MGVGLKHDLNGHKKEIYTVRWTPTGPGSAHPDSPLHLCTASFDGTVKVWRPRCMQCVEIVADVLLPASIQVWDSESGGLLFDLKRYGQPVYSLCANPAGNILAAGSLGGYVTLWSLSDGSLVRTKLWHLARTIVIINMHISCR